MRFFFIIAFLVFTPKINAQTEERPYFVSFGWNMVDYLNSVPTKTNYNVEASSLRISAGRHIWKGLSVELAYGTNTIKSYPGIDGTNLDHLAVDIYGLYSFRRIIYEDLFDVPLGSWDPYLAAGAGVSWLERPGEERDEEANMLNAGFGINYWFNDSLAITAQAIYKNSKNGWLDPYREYFLGIKYVFGFQSGAPCFP